MRSARRWHLACSLRGGREARLPCNCYSRESSSSICSSPTTKPCGRPSSPCGRLSFAPWGSAWAPLAWALIVYSLTYPAINALDHRSLLRIPTFGLPCPTTIFTAGVLMLATPRCWSLSVVPVIWAAIGGSATFLLGVYADTALPIAGIALAIFSVRRATPEQRRAGRAVPG